MSTRLAWAVCVLALGLEPWTAALGEAFGLAARVNGAEISNQQLEKSFEEYLRENKVNVGAIRYPDRYKAMKRETLDLLIDQVLLWQAAQEADMVATPAEVTQAFDDMQSQFKSADNFLSRLAAEGYNEASYREHLRRLVSARKYLESLAGEVEVSDAEIHAFYTENPDKFRVPEVVRARHILIKMDAAASEQRKREAHEQIEAILAQAREGADFAQLASEHSQDSTASQGGDLGHFPRGRMVKPFEEAAFALQPGELSGVVETPFGLHIIKLEERHEPRTLLETDARDRIRDYLAAAKSKQAVTSRIEALRSSADIEILVPL